MLETRPENIYGWDLQQLESLVTGYGWPSYTARQIALWLYKRHADDFSQMTNLSKKIRSELASSHIISVQDPVEMQLSADGTKKYLFPVENKGYIESVFIPEDKRKTLCISSQAGCRMGCRFCMTGRMGLKGNLSTGEILNQVRSIPERDLITNLVFMGMGEPFDNLEAVLQSLEILTAEWGFSLSPRRITVSTIGVVPAIGAFLNRSRCNLAISLHTPFEEERREMVPMSKAHPLADIMAAIRSYPIEKQRRISFEYIVFKDVNHSQHHVKALARLLDKIRCHINLLSFHPIPGSSYRSPDQKTIEAFRDALDNKGIMTTIRKSRGEDIQAACGLLSCLK